ncbi:MAG: T9SS type A sorting domain-containing protein [Bacteroidales bacterium]|nr:T9SS type A sorting domain-containing protein [Bacteroidales bacterium]
MKFFCTLLFTLICFYVNAQFTQYPSFNEVKEVCDLGEKKLCVCNFCAFIVDEDGEIKTLTKGKPLTSAEVSCGGAEKSGKFYAVGYENGNLDVFVGKDFFGLKNISFNNSKINALYCSDTLIIAACNSGVAVVDVNKREVKSFCEFFQPVLKVQIIDNQIFAKTLNAVYAVDFFDINIEDFFRWKVADLFSIKEEDVDYYKTLIKNTLANDNINFLKTSADGKISLGKEFWTEISNGEIKNIKMPDDGNLTSAFYNPYNSSHVFLGNENGKLYEYQNFTLKAEYDLFEKVVDMDCTSEGDLFVLKEKSLSVFDHNGSWHEGFKTSNATALKKISDNEFWILRENQGITAVNLNSTPLDFSDDIIKNFYPKTSGGQNIGSFVTSLCLDNNKKVWVGTNKGVCVLSYSDEVFKDQFSFVKPIITETSEKDGSYSQYLLNTKHITAIECDGKGRKWISTLGSGVFVVSDSGDEEVLRFNKENSALPSDTIYFMKYCGKTGEVFFATSCGLASYMTDTQDSQKDLDNIKIYPNPVRENYSGEIFISGLEDNCDVRITDIAGKLVYKTVSQGGKISWDGKNLKSNRCATGVYLIFITALDSKNTTVKKLLMIK